MLAGDLTVGPVGARDAGLAVGEYCPVTGWVAFNADPDAAQDISGAWLRELMLESTAQQAKLLADPDVGALYATLKPVGQAALALVPILALALFGASDARSTKWLEAEAT